jgi:hypothetical protein
MRKNELAVLEEGDGHQHSHTESVTPDGRASARHHFDLSDVQSPPSSPAPPPPPGNDKNV